MDLWRLINMEPSWKPCPMVFFQPQEWVWGQQRNIKGEFTNWAWENGEIWWHNQIQTTRLIHPRKHAPSFRWCYPVEIWNWLERDFVAGRYRRYIWTWHKFRYHVPILEQRKNEKVRTTKTNLSKTKNALAKWKGLKSNEAPKSLWGNLFRPFRFSMVFLGIINYDYIHIYI